MSGATEPLSRLSQLGVTQAPTGGQGLALDPTAAIPDSVTTKFLPWIVDIDVFMTATSNKNFNTNNVDANQLWNGNRSSSGAQDDEITYNVVLAAGTWTFELLHTTANNRGIYTVQMKPAGSSDTLAVGTVDGYSAATAYNVRNSLTGFSVPKTGLYVLKLLMATKNGSSSNYFGSIQHIQFRRTA